MTLVYIGIGSNLDEPKSHVRLAFEDLGRIPDTSVVKRSSLYRSAPMGYAAQPDFVNAVAEIQTSLPASRLLAEPREGNQASTARNGTAMPPAPSTWTSSSTASSR